MQENEPVAAVVPVSAPALGAALPVESTDAVTSAMNEIPEKPEHFTMTIQGGMLEALGIKQPKKLLSTQAWRLIPAPRESNDVPKYCCLPCPRTSELRSQTTATA